jgi:acyl carrier protein
MAETRLETLRQLQAIAKELRLTYEIKESELTSEEPMDIDSLEFMSFIIEIQSQFGLKISDEEVQTKGLRSIKNLVSHLTEAAKSHPAVRKDV